MAQIECYRNDEFGTLDTSPWLIRLRKMRNLDMKESLKSAIFESFRESYHRALKKGQISKQEAKEVLQKIQLKKKVWVIRQR